MLPLCAAPQQRGDPRRGIHYYCVSNSGRKPGMQCTYTEQVEPKGGTPYSGRQAAAGGAAEEQSDVIEKQNSHTIVYVVGTDTGKTKNPFEGE